MQVRGSFGTTGAGLSNTSIIYLAVQHNLAKVRVILDMGLMLEGAFPERQRRKMSRRLIR